MKKSLVRMLINSFFLLFVFCLSTNTLLAAFTQLTSDSTFSDIEKIQPAKNQISFYFQNIEIRLLLQIIAKTSGLNFIISDAVKGSTTLHLKDVTWQQALKIILESNGLAQQRIANTIFISTTEDMSNRKAKELQSEQEIANLAPLISTIIKLKYTDAPAMAVLLKGPQGTLLTQRGQVSVDPRTNSLIIKDTKATVDMITKTVKKLDVQTRQVSIEARIVNIDTNYEEQLGVRFGMSNTRSLSGTLAGANQLAQGVGVANVSPVNQRLNFNLPANSLSSGAIPGSIGLALARLGPILLDLELSALEEEGHSQIISRPRVVAANQQKAVIMTGEEIPYQESTSSGATSISFKKAVLSLEIIPQITPDNRINLKLKATQDTRGQQLIIAAVLPTGSATAASGGGGGSASASASTTGAVFGPPTINTQQVESSILLNDNETVVVGGVYKTTKTNTLDRIPFFGNLPYLGLLFRYQGIHNQTTELLIFITPKIVQAKAKGTPIITNPELQTGSFNAGVMNAN